MINKEKIIDLQKNRKRVIQMNKKGVYIHIPFCSKKCDYCDFVSYSMDRKAQEMYFEALCVEIDRLKTRFVNEVLKNIYKFLIQKE